MKHTQFKLRTIPHQYFAAKDYIHGFAQTLHVHLICRSQAFSDESAISTLLLQLYLFWWMPGENFELPSFLNFSFKRRKLVVAFATSFTGGFLRTMLFNGCDSVMSIVYDFHLRDLRLLHLKHPFVLSAFWDIHLYTIIFSSKELQME